MRKTRHTLLAALTFAAMGFTAAGTASASSYIHSTHSEKGYVIHPEHFKSDKTRTQMQAETAEFVKNGGTDRFRSSIYPPLESQDSTMTRKQVMDELKNESPAQRKARLEMMRG
ncbi:DUF4148 domain-containing protein [Diaphorobacter caeni]|uniref:DUF4148 domain-containing protein n=1 Tax=Diaphorobacter caeni TaxID=2784387 RepID=UPI0018906CC5|nr:DUF4148 domain-containing protein [Diaphorobacter caeni]MBF5005874.1 DUF4148 domain-containing protein [Diaphorobacter caeni]